jgi:hypothetical protein
MRSLLQCGLLITQTVHCGLPALAGPILMGSRLCGLVAQPMNAGLPWGGVVTRGRPSVHQSNSALRYWVKNRINWINYNRTFGKTHENFNYLPTTQFNMINTNWKLFTKDNKKFQSRFAWLQFEREENLNAN